MVGKVLLKEKISRYSRVTCCRQIVSNFYMRIFYAVTLFSCLLFSCRQKQNNTFKPTISDNNTLKLLPLGNIEDQQVKAVFLQLEKIHPSVQLLPAVPLPAFANYKPRNRYRADTIIQWLRSQAGKNESFIAITAADISTTKGNIKDFGIMGLGYQPGRACVASLFRLKNKNNLYKVAIHELGHNAGLPHCPQKTCYLRDAEGKDPTGEEIAFCGSCTAYLKNRGWKL